jgi:hypothetical protein
MHKLFLKHSDITSSSDDSTKSPKCYIYVENDKVYGEHDDKTEERINSISLPISDVYEGSLTSAVCLPVESFQLFNIMQADSIKIQYSDFPCLKVDSIKQVGSNKIITSIISKLIKG